MTIVLTGTMGFEGKVRCKTEGYPPKSPGGKILICGDNPMDIVLYVNKIRGLILKESGILSHAAIVARELGIPCMRMKNARKLLANKKIQLDSQDKIVRIL